MYFRVRFGSVRKKTSIIYIYIFYSTLSKKQKCASVRIIVVNCTTTKTTKSNFITIIFIVLIINELIIVYKIYKVDERKSGVLNY